MTELAGHVALVTGASRGIGRATAVALARAGCDVAINYRQKTTEAFETSRLVEATGRRALVVQADVSVDGDVSRMAELVLRDLGEVAVMIHNAGQAHPKAVEEITTEDFDA